MPIHLPPLRDRDNDILLLATNFLQQFCKENNIPIPSISNAAKEKLLNYSYPGNVRELKSAIELAVVMCNGDEILQDDIKFNSIIKEDELVMDEMTLKEYNFKIIKYLLDKYDHNIMLVSKKLDIGKSSIYRYLKEMGEKAKE